MRFNIKLKGDYLYYAKVSKLCINYVLYDLSCILKICQQKHLKIIIKKINKELYIKKINKNSGKTEYLKILDKSIFLKSHSIYDKEEKKYFKKLKPLLKEERKKIMVFLGVDELTHFFKDD